MRELAISIWLEASFQCVDLEHEVTGNERRDWAWYLGYALADEIGMQWCDGYCQDEG